MSKQFRLPKCDKCNFSENIVDSSQAGQVIQCAECGVDIQLPSLSGLKAYEPFVFETQQTSSRRRWSNNQGTLFSFGLAILLLAGTIGGVFSYFAWTYTVTEGVVDETVTGQFDEMIDNASAMALLKFWMEDVRDGALPAWEEPPSVKYAQLSTAFATLSYIMYGIAALGFGLIVSSLISGPKR